MGSEAIAFLERAIHCGASPASRWRARLALIYSDLDVAEAAVKLGDNDDSDPFVKTVAARIRSDWRGLVEASDAWFPTSEYELDVRAVLRAQAHLELGQPNLAIDELIQRAELTSGAGVLLLASRLVLARASRRTGSAREADAEQALVLALQARDRRRRWRADSVEPLLAAIQAAGLLRDWEEVLHLADGDGVETASATTEQLDPRVREKAALAAAMLGRVDQARRMLGDGMSSFDRAQVEAVILEREQASQDAVERAWRRALEQASSDEQTLVAAYGLASTGVWPIPELEEIRPDYPEEVSSIDLLQEASAAGPGDELALRGSLHRGPEIALRLAELLYSDGRILDSADVLVDAAGRWDDLSLRMMAVRRYIEAGALERAEKELEGTLLRAGPQWRGRRRAYAMQYELAATQGRWDRAVDAAEQLLLLDPVDDDTHWAHARALYGRGSMEDAWGALNARGQPLEPANVSQGHLWLSLCGRFMSRRVLVPRTLAMLKRLPDDQELVAHALGIMYSPRTDSEDTIEPEDLEALHRLTAEYSERFPNTEGFRMVEVDLEDPLESLREELRRGAERVGQAGEAANKVRSGQWPLALLADLAGRSYTEACIKRPVGFIQAVPPNADVSEGIVPAADLRGLRSAIDISALYAISLLQDATRTAVLGAGSCTLLDAAFRDLLSGRDNLGYRATLFTGYNSETDQPTVTEITEELAAQYDDRARAMLSIGETLARTPWGRLLHFPEMDGGRESPWLGTIDYAIERGAWLWADDVALRAVARQKGARSFGTVGLLQTLQELGLLAKDSVETALIDLMAGAVVDIPVTRTRLEEIANREAWVPQTAALYLTRAATWVPSGEALPFALTALRRATLNGDDEGTARWAQAASIGLISTAEGIGDNYEAVTGNLVFFAKSALAEPWLTPSSLASVVRGIRMAMSGLSLGHDPIHIAFEQVYRDLLALAGPDGAARVLSHFSLHLTRDDQEFVTRLILGL